MIRYNHYNFSEMNHPVRPAAFGGVEYGKSPEECYTSKLINSRNEQNQCNCRQHRKPSWQKEREDEEATELAWPSRYIGKREFNFRNLRIGNELTSKGVELLVAESESGTRPLM